MMVVAALLVVLASMLQPTMDSLRHSAAQRGCEANQRHLLTAMDFYLEDNDEYPYADTKTGNWVYWGNSSDHMSERNTLGVCDE